MILLLYLLAQPTTICNSQMEILNQVKMCPNVMLKMPCPSVKPPTAHYKWAGHTDADFTSFIILQTIMTSRYIVDSLLSEEWDHSGENITSSAVGACCAVWSPHMWFTGRLQRTGGPEAAGNDLQTVTACLSVPSYTTTRAAQGLLGTCKWQRGIFFNRAHTGEQTPAAAFYLLFLTKESGHTSSWPSIKHLPSIKPKKGRFIPLNLHITVWHVIAWSWGDKRHFINQIVLTHLHFFGFS